MCELMKAPDDLTPIQCIVRAHRLAYPEPHAGQSTPDDAPEAFDGPEPQRAKTQSSDEEVEGTTKVQKSVSFKSEAEAGVEGNLRTGGGGSSSTGTVCSNVCHHWN